MVSANWEALILTALKKEDRLPDQVGLVLRIKHIKQISKAFRSSAIQFADANCLQDTQAFLRRGGGLLRQSSTHCIMSDLGSRSS